MANQPTRQVTYLNGVDKDTLAEIYGSIQGTIAAKTVSGMLKNTDYIGGEGVRGGTIKVRRFKSSVVQAYGTARAANAGNKFQNNGVDVLINTDKELAEELTSKDRKLYDTGGLGDLLANRKGDYAISMAVDLEKAYFLALQTAANVFDTTAFTGIDQKLLGMIQYLETLINDNVQGVNREDMVLTLAPKKYDDLLTLTYALPNPLGGIGVQARMFHDVMIMPAVRQTVDAILQVKGSVAQPVVLDTPRVDVIPLSSEEALYMAYYYGTKVITPDLTFKCALDGNISA